MNESKNAGLVNDGDQLDDELGLVNFAAFIRVNLRTLLFAAFIGGVLGLAVTFILPAQWEASTLIRIGQLGNAEGVGSAIEPPLQVVDRIKNKSFRNDVLKNLGMAIDEDDPDANLFRNTLKVKLEKSELISLSLRGKSPDEVKRHMDAVINELKNIHVKMSVPTINRWHQELEFVELALKQANTKTEQVANLLGNQSDLLNDRNFSQTALLSNILIAREEELRAFHARKRMLEERLSPERTFATNVLGRVDVSQEPVFPRKSLFAVVGIFTGLVLAMMLPILRSVGFRSGT
jgi:uncharacterized protein involved in exopolysaccharide biosynthesis